MTTRDRILDAAEQVMRTDGLARSTTRKIAAAAGFSEATIYKHFASKEDLFVAVLGERLPPFVGLLRAANADADARPVREQLVEVVAGGLAFYEASMPIAGSVFAEPELLARHSAALRARNAGPGKPVAILAEFLRQRQQTGAIRSESDPGAAAALLLGACFQRAFLNRFEAAPPMSPAERREVAASLVDTLWAGIAPDR
jgi:AcrR family transcriptional regulator